MLFPLFAAAALAALLPLMMFLSFRREFAALHPAWPPHYLFLARRVFGALVRNNQLKVGAQAVKCDWKSDCASHQQRQQRWAARPPHGFRL